jgi:hypothetical protein
MKRCSLDEQPLSQQKLKQVSSNYLIFFKNKQLNCANSVFLLKDGQSYDLI